MRLRANFVKVVYQETTAYWHGKRDVWVKWKSQSIRIESQVHHWTGAICGIYAAEIAQGS